MIVPIRIFIWSNPDEKKLAENNFENLLIYLEYNFLEKKKYILSLARAKKRNKIWIRPAIITLQDKKVKKFACKYAAIISEIISIRFKIIGSAADNANLLFAFKIELHIDETLIRIKKGNKILETLTSSLNFSLSLVKPGAIIVIKKGMKISIIRTRIVEKRKKIKKILVINFWDSIIKSSLISLAYIGTNAEFSAPSEKILLKVFGNLKAIKKISAITPVPKKLAISMSLMKPKILLIDVNTE